MSILHLYFWKKKHKYHTMGGAIYGKTEVKSMFEEEEEEEWEEDEDWKEEDWK